MKHPMHPGEITPEWLTMALREGGYLKKTKVKKVTHEILGEGKGLLSSVVRAKLEYESYESDAPNSVVVKIEPESEASRLLEGELHAFQREIRFYREVASKAPIRLPQLYYAVDQPPAYSMVMEDLSALTPGDQVVGMHESQIINTVEAVAHLQAHYWNNEALADLDWMPTFNTVQDDFAEKWDSFLMHFGHYLSPHEIRIGDKLANSIEWLGKEINGRPKTIVHNDLREDNLLFGEPGSATEVMILDWQLTIRSMGAFDVAFILGGSELPSERKGHHYKVLRRWHEKLIQEGVEAYSFDDAGYDYQLGSLLALCYPVHFHNGFVDPQGRKQDLVRVLIDRQFSSAVELAVEEILP